MARTMALDIGDRRIGVAVSDASKMIARPLLIIDRKTEDALARLRALVLEYAPDLLVVGYPVHMDDAVSEQARAVDAFCATLRTAIALPVAYMDERFSTSDAREIIAGKRRKDKPRHDDALAAAVILQRHLDDARADASDAADQDDVED